ncbi:MAG: CPBP family intramembrane metalloprotease, partial [Anaerolineae bacterium]|nr:CPBP family intramembrane metalloprotease [Anaerolineae bacterium]
MDFSLLIFGLFALIYLGGMLYLANIYEARRATPPSSPQTAKSDQQLEVMLRWMLYGIAAIVFVLGILILQVAFLPIADSRGLDVQLPKIDTAPAVINFIIAALVALASVRLVTSERARQIAGRLTGTNSHYNPQSYIHIAAMILALAMVSVVLGQAVLSGGVTGIAEDVANAGVSTGELVFQTVLFIVIAMLGVGTAIRRTLPQSAERLGLRLPKTADWIWGIGTGILLYLAQIGVVMVWVSLTSPEQVTNQSAAADQFASLFDTLPLAVILSLSAAVSEEILFRGALQPVLGIGLTSLFFALVHLQYLLTPITLIIVAVGLGLGWLRQRHSTTAAII